MGGKGGARKVAERALEDIARINNGRGRTRTVDDGASMGFTFRGHADIRWRDVCAKKRTKGKNEDCLKRERMRRWSGGERGGWGVNAQWACFIVCQDSGGARDETLASGRWTEKEN